MPQNMITLYFCLPYFHVSNSPLFFLYNTLVPSFHIDVDLRLLPIIFPILLDWQGIQCYEWCALNVDYSISTCFEDWVFLLLTISPHLVYKWYAQKLKICRFSTPIINIVSANQVFFLSIMITTNNVWTIIGFYGLCFGWSGKCYYAIALFAATKLQNGYTHLYKLDHFILPLMLLYCRIIR